MINFFYLFLRRGISYYHVHDHGEKKNLLEFFGFTPFSLYIYIYRWLFMQCICQHVSEPHVIRPTCVSSSGSQTLPSVVKFESSRHTLYDKTPRVANDHLSRHQWSFFFSPPWFSLCLFKNSKQPFNLLFI